MAKKETIPKVDYSPLIKYEEELVVINNGGSVTRKINRTPYLEHNGYKVFISRTEFESIMDGRLNPEDILKNIREDVIYRYSH